MRDKKLILTDCDGVLLDWENAFDEWMQFRGYKKVPNYDITAYGLHVHYGIPKNEVQKLIRQFNESAAIGFLEPTRDAEKWLPILAKNGYRFVVITSFSDDPYACNARKHNLKIIFGNIFDDVVCLDTGADKNEALFNWCNKGTFWVEDKSENAELGEIYGLKTYLIDHKHNSHVKNPRIKRVGGWAEITKDIMK